jgi:hypothetical protein
MRNKNTIPSKSTFTEQIKSALKQRAAHYLQQKFLVVNYYRIRRRLAYPLPVQSLHIPKVPIPGIENYPWATWMTWELEERINSLGWAAQLFDDNDAREAVCIDLLNLTQWPQYQQYPTPDLSLGHAARILANAYRQWNWLPDEVRRAMKNALQRIVNESGLLVEERLKNYSDHQEILNAPNIINLVANIPVIGAIGVALAANAIDDPRKSTFNHYIKISLQAMFAMRETGFAEGVAYDGYVLDFVMDWLAFLPDADKSTFIDHPQFARFLDESIWLGAPGDIVQVAELNDVEPVEMPFHISAQAKAFALQPLPERAWYLNQCRLDIMRADALAMLHFSKEQMSLTQKQPEVQAKDAHYAIVLRSGWNADDVAVAMANSNSPMGHIHTDNGSVAIGTEGKWFIQTPGYQQYLANSEREFTLGISSRNAPAINGQVQIHKLPKLLNLKTESQLQTAEIDLTQCYPEELKLQSVQRCVELIEKQLIVVEDNVVGEDITEIYYYWHGHPDSAWWIEDGWARLYLEGKTLWIHSPQVNLEENQLQRLRGSRGQLTLAPKVLLAESAPQIICWYFLLSDVFPERNTLLQRFCKSA